MKILNTQKLGYIALFSACLGGLTFNAMAVDGVILITQANAMAGNVTPGDAPGFPVVISQPGSYRLASNLALPDANTTGIEINASNVTLDLNGFAITGNTVCGTFGISPGVFSCTPNGTGHGILGGTNNGFNGNTAITVTNGTISGMGNAGVALDNQFVRVSNVTAISNGRQGIFVGSGSSVMGCSSISNGNAGIQAGAGSTVLNNTVNFNRFSGLVLEGATAPGYANNVLFGNGVPGVQGGIQMGGNVCDGAPCP